MGFIKNGDAQPITSVIEDISDLDEKAAKKVIESFIKECKDKPSITGTPKKKESDLEN